MPFECSDAGDRSPAHSIGASEKGREVAEIKQENDLSPFDFAQGKL